MAYTEPTDPITGDLYTAAWHVTDVNDNIRYLKSQLPTWSTWTPTISVSGGTAPTYTAIFSNRYYVSEKMAMVSIVWRNISGGTAGAGANPIVFTLPVAGVFQDMSYWTAEVIGYGYVSEASGTLGLVYVTPISATTVRLYLNTSYSVTGDDQSSNTRTISAKMIYEI